MAPAKKTKNGSDLSSVELNETSQIIIMHPVDGVPLEDDNGKEMYVEVYGQDSDQYQQVLRNQKNRLIAKAQRSKQINVTAEMQETNALELLCKSIKDWSLQLDGQPFEFSEENAKSLFKRFPWIKEQVEAGIYDRRNFTKG